MNALEPDAMSLGNHEFDDGVEGLAPFLVNVNFPVLACNLDLYGEDLLENEENLKPSVIFERNGYKIGVIGYVTPETRFLAAPSDVIFLDEIQAVDKEAKRLKSKGVEILIALGHSGHEKDCIIAREVPDIDLVIGGHTNTFLWNGPKPPQGENPEGPYPKIIVQKSNKLVPVVQAYAYTKYIGKLRLQFNRNGELIRFHGQPIMLTSAVEQEKDILRIIDKYKPGVKAATSRVIGMTRVFLDGITCRIQECSLGNLLTDSMILEYIERFGDNSSAMALLNGGAIRSSISKGKAGFVTMEALMTVLPFGNDLIIGQYTGKIIKEALEHSIHRYIPSTPYGEFLQMSGLRVSYNLSANPGNRVNSVQTFCEKCPEDYQDLDPTSTYNVVLNFFLSRGGDGYDMLRDKALSKKNLGVDDLRAAEMYFKTRSPVWHGPDGRISFLHDWRKSSATWKMTDFNIVLIAYVCIIVLM